MKTTYGKNNLIIAIIIMVSVLSAVSLFVLNLYNTTNKETEIVLKDDSFEVKGMFGDTFLYDRIQSVELKDTIPAIGRMANGSGLGEVQKGIFEVQGLGECKLYKFSDNGPFIYVNVSGKYVIINYKEKEKTEKLYADLKAKINM
jgi:hypothetical protein